MIRNATTQFRGIQIRSKSGDIIPFFGVIAFVVSARSFVQIPAGEPLKRCYKCISAAQRHTEEEDAFRRNTTAYDAVQIGSRRDVW